MPTPQEIELFRQKARQAGYSDEEINAEIQRKQGGMETTSPQIFQEQARQQARPTAGGFLGNIAKSAGRTALDIGKAGLNIFNPNLEKNTLANLGRTALGAGQLAVPGEQKQEPYAKAVGGLYKERYGGIKNIQKTLYEDPVGALLDASILAGATSSALKAAGAISKSAKLTKAGETAGQVAKVTDPLRAGLKVGGLATRVTKVGEGVSKVGKKLEEFGVKTGQKAVKAAPSDIVNFQADVGKSLGEFQKNFKIYGSTEEMMAKTQDLINQHQGLYNDLTRTGQRIPVKGYTNKLRQKANEIRRESLSPQANRRADELTTIAEFVESKADRAGTVSIDQIVNFKGESFGAVTPSTLRDAAAVDANKMAGGIGIEYVDNYAKGSAGIGKQLQGLRTFDEILRKRAGKGQGSQLFNVHRGGALGGAVGGTIGGIPGLAGGYALGEAVNTPAGLSRISRATQAIGGALQQTPAPIQRAGEVISKGTGAVARAAETGARMLEPTPLEFEGGRPALPATPTTTPTGQVQGMITIRNKKTGETKQVPEAEANQYLKPSTGLPPREAIIKIMAADLASGGKNISELATILNAIDKQAELNKIEAGDEVKLTEKQKAFQVAGQAAAYAKTLLDQGVYTGPGGKVGGFIGEKTGLASDPLIDYRATISFARTVIKNALLGGAITPTEEKNLMGAIPEFNDPPSVARQKLITFIREAERFASGGQVIPSGLQFQGGQTAF